jgi:hypothetical protein
MERIIDLHNTLLNKDNFTIENNTSNTDNTINSVLVNYSNATFNYSNATFNYLIENSNIVIKPINFEGFHLLRIIKNKFNLNYDIFTNKLILYENVFVNSYTTDYLVDFILSIGEIIQNNIYDYCTCCHLNVKILGLNNITTCENESCIRMCNHLVTNNIVTNSFNHDKIVTIHLVKFLLSCCLDHPKKDLAFDPIPKMNSVENIDDFVRIIPPILKDDKTLGNLVNLIESSNDDIEFYFKTNNIVYSIIKNSLSSNYFNLFSKEDIIKNNSIKYINIKYPTSIEKEFENCPNFLFHGAGLFSWYPIIKKGLKVLSGTQLQANGAAYGTGIYLSDSFGFAMGYSRGEFKVIGVFQLKQSSKNFKKAANIFVVPDDKILLLRSLIIVNSNSVDVGIIKSINDYYILESEISHNTIIASRIIVQNKRLANELKLLNQNNNYLVNIIDELTEWDVHFDGYKFKINFSGYPTNPPSIVLSDGNVPTCIIGANNYINIPIIDPRNWTIQNKLCDIFSQLKNIIDSNKNL